MYLNDLQKCMRCSLFDVYLSLFRNRINVSQNQMKLAVGCVFGNLSMISLLGFINTVYTETNRNRLQY